MTDKKIYEIVRGKIKRGQQEGYLFPGARIEATEAEFQKFPNGMLREIGRTYEPELAEGPESPLPPIIEDGDESLKTYLPAKSPTSVMQKKPGRK